MLPPYHVPNFRNPFLIADSYWQPKTCIHRQIISVVSSINDDNPSIISVVSWISTDDLEMDADILGFGWRILQVYFYGVDKFVLPRSFASLWMTSFRVWKQREGKMKDKINVNHWYTVSMKLEGKKQTNRKVERIGRGIPFTWGRKIYIKTRWKSVFCPFHRVLGLYFHVHVFRSFALLRMTRGEWN